MDVIHTTHQLQHIRQQWQKAQYSVGFVPTMGNLHQGHMALIQRARQECQKVIVSIFVNPSQFGENEDLSQYPRTLTEDIARIKQDCDCLFIPEVHSIYPNGTWLTTIDILPFTKQYCGLSRPNHFSGVLTVVNVLFNLTQPTKAYFGRKDYQQLWLIQRMTQDLHLPVHIVCVDTGRAPDGLALSSRNAYLDTDQRQRAPILYKTLQSIACKIQQNGILQHQKIIDTSCVELHKNGFIVEYLCLCNPKTLEQITPTTIQKIDINTQFLLLVAAKLGKARLIDNVLFLINAKAS